MFDETVRKALQIPKERLTSVGIDLEKLDILETIRRKLLPYSTEQISASLEKVNVYTKGGFFASHRDTPRDENCFGSLVICSPSVFAGGNLHVKAGNGKNTKTCQWDQALDPSRQGYRGSLGFLTGHHRSPSSSFLEEQFKLITLPAKPVCPWVAFFGNCEHSIDKVLCGHRITLSYVLRHSCTVHPPAVLSYTSANNTSSDGANAVKNDGSGGTSSNSNHVIDLTVEGASSSSTPDYHKMTVPQLKQICRQRNLKLGGKKDEIISRLLGLGSRIQLVSQPYPDEEAIQKGVGISNYLRAALQDPNFMPEGGFIGVPCLHLYEKDSDLPGPDQNVGRATRSTDFRLKGASSSPRPIF